MSKADEPLRLATTRQLFLDNAVVEWLDQVERRVMPARKHAANPLVRPSAGWEPSGYVLYGSVLHDAEDGLFKMWALGMGRRGAPSGDPCADGGVCYFLSDDGLTWHRPELDVVAVEGRRSNIVVAGPQSGHPTVFPHWLELFGVSKDERDPAPERRYKMGYGYVHRDYTGSDAAPFHPGQRRGLGAAFSADGLHWTPHSDLVTHATCDGPTFWHFDEALERWVLYGRTKHIDPGVSARWGHEQSFQRHHWGRAVHRAASADFLSWEPDDGELVLSTDVLDGPQHEIYGMSVFRYEEVYIGLVQMFLNYGDRDILEIQLAVSRDGKHFERVGDRSPFIPVGDVGDWDRFNNSLANNPPLPVGDELWFYYGGRNSVHTGAGQGMVDNGTDAGTRVLAGVGLASVKRDRLVALQASFDAGTVRTRPLCTSARTLHVNAEVPFGRLTVTVRDRNGEAVPCLSSDLTEVDGTDLVALEGLEALQGRAFVIDFTLRNGRLYGFWAE